MRREIREKFADITGDIIHLIYLQKGIISPEMYERWLLLERGEE